MSLINPEKSELSKADLQSLVISNDPSVSFKKRKYSEGEDDDNDVSQGDLENFTFEDDDEKENNSCDDWIMI